MKRLITIPALVLLAACASGDAAQSSSSETDSTGELAFTIEQTNTPLVMVGESNADFVYRIGVTNRTAAPLTLRTVRIESLGSEPVRLRNTVHTVDRAIAPGATESFDLGVRGTVTDFEPGGRLPLVVRARLVTRGDDGKEQTAEFVRRMNADYKLGIYQ